VLRRQPPLVLALAAMAAGEGGLFGNLWKTHENAGIFLQFLGMRCIME